MRISESGSARRLRPLRSKPIDSRPLMRWPTFYVVFSLLSCGGLKTGMRPEAIECKTRLDA